MTTNDTRTARERAEECYGCANPTALEGDVRRSDNLPLCTTHFNAWVVRYLGEDAPCNAHLIETKELA